MRTHEFIRAMRSKLGCQDAETIQDWLEFAGDIADGTETDYERELDDIMRALSYVRNNFSSDVLKKSIRFPTLANEVIYGATLFHSGLPAKQVADAARDGRLEDGYIPASEDEVGTLSLIWVEKPEDRIFLVENEPGTVLLCELEEAVYEAQQCGMSISSILKDRSRTNLQLSSLGGVLARSMQDAFETTTAIGSLFCCDPVDFTVSEVHCKALEQRRSQMEPAEITAQERLQKEIEAGHMEYQRNWLNLSHQELINRADEIAAVNMLAGMIPASVSEVEAESLLCFLNPLAAAAAAWRKEGGLGMTGEEGGLKELLLRLAKQADQGQAEKSEAPEEPDRRI